MLEQIFVMHRHTPGVGDRSDGRIPLHGGRPAHEAYHRVSDALQSGQSSTFELFVSNGEESSDGSSAPGTNTARLHDRWGRTDT
ncbi:MAG: hypothetical protein OJF51_001708 [Nitrospira sp.]|nr:MAG: hypothetical protein OJF51_001708 [Nitrospira sp.]